MNRNKFRIDISNSYSSSNGSISAGQSTKSIAESTQMYQISKPVIKDYIHKGQQQQQQIALNKKHAIKKKISFSSLNLENPSFHSISSNTLMSPRFVSNSQNSFENSIINLDFKSPTTQSAERFMTNGFNSSSFNLPSFFVEERDASINSKVDLHKKIMDIGDNIHETITNKLRGEYEKMLKLKELEIISHYEKEKEMQIEIERVAFSTKLDQIKTQLKNEYDRLTKEKICENEIYNQNIAKEHIEDNKIAAKKHLEETIGKLKESFEHEKKNIIDKAVRKEKEKTHKYLEEQRELYENKMEELNKNWIQKSNQALENLRNALTKEFEKAIELNNEKARKEKNVEIERVKEIYELKLKESRKDYDSRQDEIDALNLKLVNLNKKNDQLIKVIEELRKEFQNCIAHFTHLKKHEADFLFPLTDNLHEMYQI